MKKTLTKNKIAAVLIMAFMICIAGCEGDLLINKLPVEPAIKPNEASNMTAPDRIDIYLDASLSMKGYLVKKDNSRFDDYVYPRILEIGMSDFNNAEKLRLFKCGTDIIQIATEQIEYAAQFSRGFDSKYKSFYDTNELGESCGKGERDNGCVNQDSDLVMILNRIANEPTGTTSIITSDLFLSTNKSKGFIGTAASPLHTIFSRGDIIAVLAVSSMFNGFIYDIFPGHKFKFHGMRPFYVLITGPKDNVRWILRRLKKRLENGPKTTWHTALFTSESIPFADMQNMMENGNVQMAETVTRSNTLLSQEFAQIPQFQISTFAPEMTLDVQLRNKDTNIVQSKMLSATLTTNLWEYVPSRGSNENPWLRLPPAGSTLTVSGDSIPILVNEQIGSLTLDRTYFADIEVKATQWEVMATLPDWINNWNFTPGMFDEVTNSKRDVFPTLNLKRVCETMADAASQGQKNTIAKIQFAVRRN